MNKSDLTTQVNTLERALGERMIHHGTGILRQWAAELGMSVYTDRIEQLDQNYQRLFDYFLTVDDANREQLLDEMTGNAYRIEDDIYADLRIKLGLSPEMHGFNGENPQSVLRYFSSCVHLQTEDFDWLESCMDDPERTMSVMLGVAALSSNLRECFSEEAMMFLINAIRSDNQEIASQALGTAILLLAHYDIRVDFFPNIQSNFLDAIGDGSVAFDTLAALVRSTKINIRDMMAKGEINTDDMPETIKQALGISENDSPAEKIQAITAWMPESENEYMAGLIDMFPGTWVYEAIVGDDPQRMLQMKMIYLSIGKMDLLWNQPEVAEPWLAERLMEDNPKPIDYINYAHCCFLRGDRLMAYENYREARILCKTAKAFYALFRPDRHMLVEHGIPLEQVYLMEDQMLTIKN